MIAQATRVAAVDHRLREPQRRLTQLPFMRMRFMLRDAAMRYSRIEIWRPSRTEVCVVLQATTWTVGWKFNTARDHGHLPSPE